ncbi:unnamed protein product [Adineta steineri]|uniref:Uncharacterized protein n=1 Tax=Adineta steineri TaxID=433720 RepID=A0A815L8V5_9BILA|nr:unnamed protein product [Adineta steineri]
MIVVSHYNEDLTWLDLFIGNKIPHIVYTRSSDPLISHGLSVNKGREVVVYLRYIVDFYSNLPSSIAFIHGHRTSVLQKDPDDIVVALRALKWNKYSYMPLTSAMTQSRFQHRALEIQAAVNYKLWRDVLQKELGPPPLTGVQTHCCASFAVTKEAILKHPKVFYSNIMNYIYASEYSDQLTGEIRKTFLPIICDRHILREEPIALLSLRFIQTIWTLIDHTPISLSILSQSKLIPSLFTLIMQHKDKPTGPFIQGVVSCLTTLSEQREMIQTMIEQGLVSVQLQLIQDQLNFSITDRISMNVLLELLSLLDRDLTYVLDIVKRALQVKKTGIGESDLPSIAEKLLQTHKPLVSLVGPMINLLPNEDSSIAKIALHNLSLLTQLIGSEGKAVLTKNHCHILSSILRTTDTTKQKLLLRALKRLINGDKRSLDVARSNNNNELIVKTSLLFFLCT